MFFIDTSYEWMVVGADIGLITVAPSIFARARLLTVTLKYISMYFCTLRLHFLNSLLPRCTVRPLEEN